MGSGGLSHPLILSMSILERKEESGRSSDLVTLLAAPMSMRKVVGLPCMGKVIFARGPPSSGEDSAIKGREYTGLPAS